MKTKELYFVAFISLFIVIFIASAFSSGITGMSTVKLVSSNASIIGQAYNFTIEQFRMGGTLNKILLTILIILIILLAIEITILMLKKQKVTRIKKIKYMIDNAEEHIARKNFVKARDIYMHVREEYNSLSEESKEKIKQDCMDLYDKIKSEVK